MARVETRVRKDGKTIHWRLGGARTGAWQSESFDQKAAALTFELAVEACGHHRPENWIRGFGWAPSPDERPVRDEPVLFAEYALRFVTSLSGSEERTRHDYERDLKNHIVPTFGGLDLCDESQAFDRTTVSTWVNDLHHGVPDPDKPRT